MSAPAPRQTPKGAPLDWSDADLDDLARITPEDIERAKLHWREHAPSRFKDLLDAVPDEEE